ncbi:MAG: M23 family metallopeptidase [Rhizomicrobium sp.]
MRAVMMLGTVLGLALFTVPPGAAVADTGLTAVWRPGGGTQWVKWGMGSSDFKAQDTAYFNQGLRIQSLSIHNGSIAAVWRPGSGTQWVKWGMSFPDFKTQDLAYFSQGLRITLFVIDGGQIAAVWRPGSGTQWVHVGLTGDQFKAQDTAYFNQGLRIAALAVSGGKLSAVWRPGSGTQWVKWGMSNAQFSAQDNAYFAQGLRQTSVAVENGQYAAVWQPGSGTQWSAHGFCSVDFKTEDAAFFAQGLRLSAIALQDGAGSPWGYPWKNGDTFNTAQGNNTPGGSHTGSQAFAFDFGLPSGTTIRAARDGVVEWTQSTLTKTYNPNAPTTPANTPFPNGSLQNWGNAVRIRHAGGFTSWYFHIQPNGVLVNAGDSVNAGQPIAKSDNTGRTSGPHLHFQVQAASINWGQSVPISFNNCQVPTSGTNVTSHTGN